MIMFSTQHNSILQNLQRDEESKNNQSLEITKISKEKISRNYNEKQKKKKTNYFFYKKIMICIIKNPKNNIKCIITIEKSEKI